MADKNRDQKGGGNGDAADLIHVILKGMRDFDEPDQQRVLTTVNAFFGHAPAQPARRDAQQQSDGSGKGVSTRGGALEGDLSVEDFLEEKRPQTDVERVVCLGYYLIVYRNQQGFKTKDLTLLNNEANQPKIGDPTNASKNAYKSHMLVQAGQGQRKLSTYGRKYVEALPDREAARALKADLPKRRGRKKTQTRKRS